MVVASDVSLDGSKLLVTMAPKDQPDVYLYDLNSKNFNSTYELFRHRCKWKLYRRR